MSYIIKPIQLGTLRNFEKSSFTYRKDVGTKIDAPLFCYVVQGHGKNVLVDSGPPSPAISEGKCPFPIDDAVFLADALQGIGLAPDGIDMVFLSHLHWDHAYNLELFPKQEIFIQKRELEYTMCPLPCDTGAISVPGSHPMPWFASFKQMTVLDGEHDIMEGLRAIPLPGHTPGVQGLLVDTAEGACLIGMDHYSLYENYEKNIPLGLHGSLFEWYASHKRAKQVADFILPGHDTRVLSRTVYGNGK